jgi:hypothetical protein
LTAGLKGSLGQSPEKLLFQKWIVRRVCSSPDTTWPAIQIAGQTVRAAVGLNPGRLVWQPLRRINDLGFQTDFDAGVMAIFDFNRLPGFNSHLINSYVRFMRSYCVHARCVRLHFLRSYF